MGAESADLKKSYEMLANTYSKDVRDSTVVIITKSNMAREYLEDRLPKAV